MLRQPIVCILGHVDHGKTSLLDSIRKTRVAAREVGQITQHIGASEIPLDVIQAFCASALEKMPIAFTIPGLLFIDTPGHDAFTNLRKRGGAIADIAVLVVDATKGVEPQTLEAIEILKEYKTPFLVAFNKVDAISGWNPKGGSFLESWKTQPAHVKERLDTSLYQLIGKLYEYGFSADRFDRVDDFTKQILIVPVSAKTRQGLSELLLYVAGLAQRFLEKRLTLHEKEPAQGSILEVKEEKGLGKTLDVILYDGVLKTGDDIGFSTNQGPKIGKVKALLKPKALDEMRDPRQKFSYVDKVAAASGVKIACENSDIALSGSSVYGVSIGQENAIQKRLSEEFSMVVFESESQGAVLKADSLGSLEAIVKLFTQHGIALKRAGIGKVSKNDVTLAKAIAENNKYLGVVFSFHQKTDDDILRLAEKEKVPVFQEGIIYNLLQGYTAWKEQEQINAKKEAFTNLILPAQIRILSGHVFRVSGPCIVGVEVIEGRIRKGYPLMDEKGQNIGTVRAIQENKKPVQEAGKSKQLAVSIDGAIFGKNLAEKQDVYSEVTKEGAKLLETKYASALTIGEADLLAKIKKIKGFIAFGQ